MYTPRVPLVNGKKELMPEAKKIFESWFETFSRDGFMTPETCVDFIRNSTSDQTVTIQDNRVTRLFTEYDRDNDNRISREDFLEFYRERSE
jgi:Ca2+-binding EF-hand superfamily protein